MKTFFLILFLFVSCKENAENYNRAALTVNDEISNLKASVLKLETKVYKLETDSAYQAKQIAVLKKSDSLNTVSHNIISSKLSYFTTKLFRDSIYRFKDSVYQWKAINSVIPILSRFPKDSTAQWIDINKLKATSPVTQIPIIQSDIKAIKLINVSQSSLIEKLYDTIEVLKVFPSSDFTLDATGKFFFISKAGIDRIKAAISPPLP